MDQRTFSKADLIAEITKRIDSLDSWDLCEIGEVVFRAELKKNQFIGLSYENDEFTINIVVL